MRASHRKAPEGMGPRKKKARTVMDSINAAAKAGAIPSTKEVPLGGMTDHIAKKASKQAASKKKKSNWGKPSKEKMAGALQSLADNPAMAGDAQDDGGQMQANMTSTRLRNQTSTPGKARDIIKRRRV